MANRIFYGSLGLLLSVPYKNAAINNYFLSGVQSVGIDSELPLVSIPSIGKTQIDLKSLPPTNSINIERILSNRDVFWSELTSDFLFSTNRNSLNYQNTYFLRPEIFGSAVNAWISSQEASVRDKNIPEYDIKIIGTDETSLLDEMSGNSGVAQNIISLPRCLLTQLSYNLDINGSFSESISLTNKKREKIDSNNFDFDTIAGLDNPITNPVLLRRKNVYNNLSVYPSTIERLIRFNDFFNNIEIFGIKNINIELSIDYSDALNTGSINQNEKVNWGKTIGLPISITCSFTITARKLPQVNIDETNSDIAQESILLENDDILILEDDSYVSAQSDTEYERICIVAGVEDGDGGFKFFIWNLGNKNKITSFNQTGGSTDGSIVEYQISYRNDNNDFLTYTQVQASDSVLNPPLFEQTSEKY